jgi:hypothetical protein
MTDTVHSFSRFSTTQFVREEESWLPDPVFGVYGWLQVNDVKKSDRLPLLVIFTLLNAIL